MKLAFICVNYNNSNITKDYISSVLKIKENYNIKIIIVDNNSENSDYNNLSFLIKNLKNEDIVLLKSNENLGYFKGLNLGIKWAIENGYDEYQVIGNNDIEFSTDFLTILENLIIKNDELILAPDVITSDGIHENPHVIKKMSSLRKLKYDIYFSNYYLARLITLFYSADRKPKSYDPERKLIYMGIGALYVLTPFFFKHYSKLWDEVFLYGEEAILAGQIDHVDGKIIYEPSLKCKHYESATTSKITTKNKYKIIQSSYKIYKKYL